MRVATVDGLLTLYYDGSKEPYDEDLHNEWNDCYMDQDLPTSWDDSWDLDSWDLSEACKKYMRKRQSWEQIIVVEGVTVIPESTFYDCCKVKRVIFANTVIKIKHTAFFGCKNLIYIKWSINIRVIGINAFGCCDLSSVFLPPRCREVESFAFCGNKNLTIFHVPQQTVLGIDVVDRTKLMGYSRFEENRFGMFNSEHNERNAWVRNINNDDKYALHRACCSFQPMINVIFAIIQEQGIRAFSRKNELGLTPSAYLKENPFADITEKEIIHYYIAQMMGENES